MSKEVKVYPRYRKGKKPKFYLADGRRYTPKKVQK